jgi:hypothetical protein
MINVINPKVQLIITSATPIAFRKANPSIAANTYAEPYTIHIIPFALLYALTFDIYSVLTSVPDQKCIGDFLFNANIPIPIKTIAQNSTTTVDIINPSIFYTSDI